ncbi:MAG: hypothetical protein EAZ30_05910 [Betaproteobacteria bacterium]|nr:MAG: hypothetical protein EAZ30_05910 [Betaproteobacteria bacterium]
MRSRSFSFGDDRDSGSVVARWGWCESPRPFIDRIRLGAWYWIALALLLVFGALWRAGVIGAPARAPGLSAMVFAVMILVLAVFLAFPMGVASGVASVRWPFMAWPAMIVAVLGSATITATVCNFGRMRPELDVLALYASIVGALTLPVFLTTRKVWLSEISK